MAPSQPEVTVVIPVFNEARIVTSSVSELCAGFECEGLAGSYEVVLAENGSTDDTRARIEALQARFPQIMSVHYPSPDYGAALKAGIEAARGRLVICEEIDLCDLDFHRRALALLRAGEVDFVVGSKAAPGSCDERPWVRRSATRLLSGALRALTGFRGTDTHGLKAFDRTRLRPVLDRCVLGRDLFASELVIRAQREGLRVREIPVVVREKRRPSINLLRRVPAVLWHLARLTVLLRRGAPAGARTATARES